MSAQGKEKKKGMKVKYTFTVSTDYQWYNITAQYAEIIEGILYLKIESDYVVAAFSKWNSVYRGDVLV